MDLESIDIYDKIVALNPKYVSATHLTDPYTARVNDLCFASDRRMYLIFADAYVFTSVDGFQSLEEIKEINYSAAGLISQAQQSIDAVVETMDGSFCLWDVTAGTVLGAGFEATARPGLYGESHKAPQALRGQRSPALRG